MHSRHKVIDYTHLIHQVARVLRPGGLFLSCEWGRTPILITRPTSSSPHHPPTHPLPPASLLAPYTHAFFLTVNDALRRRGIVASPAAEHIPVWLAQSGHFEAIQERTYDVPIGDWHPDPRMRQLGVEFRELAKAYAQNVRALLVDSGGLNMRDAQELIDGHQREMAAVRGLAIRYYTVFARRVRT